MAERTKQNTWNLRAKLSNVRIETAMTVSYQRILRETWSGQASGLQGWAVTARPARRNRTGNIGNADGRCMLRILARARQVVPLSRTAGPQF